MRSGIAVAAMGPAFFLNCVARVIAAERGAKGAEGGRGVERGDFEGHLRRNEFSF